jgi:hypothetical protein
MQGAIADDCKDAEGRAPTVGALGDAGSGCRQLQGQKRSPKKFKSNSASH